MHGKPQWFRLIGIGLVWILVSSAQAATLSAVEFYHAGLRHYFLTIDPIEAAAIDAGAAGPGWSRSGGSFRVWTAAESGAQPVCRFYGSLSPGPNSHFFTVDAAECAALRAQEALSVRAPANPGGRSTCRIGPARRRP